MEDRDREVIEGLKTFFVVPDLSVMPEDFLPNFFIKGFEVYYLMDDQYLDIPSKIRILFSLFPELILFFNLDRRIGKLDWTAQIRALKEEFGDRARIGVLYGKQTSDPQRRQMEKTFLYDIGIYCGCIPLEYNKARNLVKLAGVLEANDARGRRKYLRAICAETCTFNFDLGGLRFMGRIRDISISHFSCQFDSAEPDLKLYEKVRNVQLKLAGIICTLDIVLCIKRIAKEGPLYVFVFRDSRNRDGLDPDMLDKVNRFVRETYERLVLSAASACFEEEIGKRHGGRRAVAPGPAIAPAPGDKKARAGSPRTRESGNPAPQTPVL